MKTKMIVLLFNIYLNKLQKEIKMRLKDSNHSQQIKTICDNMTRRLRGAKKWPAHQNFIFKKKKMIWTKKLTQKYWNKMMLIEICKSRTNHAKIKNNKKQIMKNNVDKKTIFVYKIHEWFNCALNDLLKWINIFAVSPSRKLEKIKNDITHLN